MHAYFCMLTVPLSLANQIFHCRGAGAFGDILFGSCQYASIRDGVDRDYSDLPFDKAEVAALAQKNPDYPGSCGRCYEVR